LFLDNDPRMARAARLFVVTGGSLPSFVGNLKAADRLSSSLLKQGVCPGVISSGDRTGSCFVLPQNGLKGGPQQLGAFAVVSRTFQVLIAEWSPTAAAEPLIVVIHETRLP
jgi:hypothetical protein